jgi:hypothetical protein
MKSKPRLQFEKRGFVFFALTSIQLLPFVCVGDPGLGKGKSRSLLWMPDGIKIDFLIILCPVFYTAKISLDIGIRS